MPKIEQLLVANKRLAFIILSEISRNLIGILGLADLWLGRHVAAWLYSRI